MSDIPALPTGPVNPEDLPVLPADDAPGAWFAPFEIPGKISSKAKGTMVSLTMTDELVRQEVLDQCEIKKPARMAILRSTQKRLAKSIKQGAPLEAPADDHPHRPAYEAVRWDCFILYVDALISGKHVSLRADEAAVDALVSGAQRS